MSLTIYLANPPPSVNAMFANIPGRGRVKTKAAKAWRDAAGWEAKAQSVGKGIAGPVIVDITVRRDNDRADIDNRAKGICDVLVDSGIIADDRYIDELCIRWGDVAGCRIVVSESTHPKPEGT